tara:strand:- start:23780 stop:24253 length:474 start_codon:yes stop_codon:yes gene_type:complete
VINIKIKNGDPCNTVITDEDGKEITGVERLVIDPIVADKPITATLKMWVNELDIDVELSRGNMLEAKGFEQVGMALVDGYLRKGQSSLITVDNQNPLIELGDILTFPGSAIAYAVNNVWIEERKSNVLNKATLGIHPPLDSNIADNAVILIYRDGDQ